uniref:Uncharacterized protein n=1 Tax=Plectus sambesii TaxID=2011161 RepID=A0A914VV27_9BILA
MYAQSFSLMSNEDKRPVRMKKYISDFGSNTNNASDCVDECSIRWEGKLSSKYVYVTLFNCCSIVDSNAIAFSAFVQS